MSLLVYEVYFHDTCIFQHRFLDLLMEKPPNLLNPNICLIRTISKAYLGFGLDGFYFILEFIQDINYKIVK